MEGKITVAGRHGQQGQHIPTIKIDGGGLTYDRLRVLLRAASRFRCEDGVQPTEAGGEGSDARGVTLGRRSMRNPRGKASEWVNGSRAGVSDLHKAVQKHSLSDAPSLDSPGYEQNPRELEIHAQYECPLPGTLQER